MSKIKLFNIKDSLKIAFNFSLHFNLASWPHLLNITSCF